MISCSIVPCRVVLGNSPSKQNDAVLTFPVLPRAFTTERPCLRPSVSFSSLLRPTHRPLSSSFLGLLYRILNINHKKELLRGLWVHSKDSDSGVRYTVPLLDFTAFGGRATALMRITVYGFPESPTNPLIKESFP